MTNDGQSKAPERPIDYLIKCVCPQVHPTETHHNQVDYSKGSQGHLDDVSSTENRHSWDNDAHLIVGVKICRYPKEAIPQHVARWIPKAGLTLVGIDRYLPIWSILMICTLQLVQDKARESNDTPKVEGCWLRHDVKDNNVRHGEEITTTKHGHI